MTAFRDAARAALQHEYPGTPVREQLLDTLEAGTRLEDADTTTEQAAPDRWNPDDECLAWQKAPRIIGGPSHTHCCRLEPAHPGLHICGCSAEFQKS